MSSPGVQPISLRGITLQNYNYLRCWFTLIHYGKEVFRTIFCWGFQRPPEHIKEVLFQNGNYTNKRYRSDFDSTQRVKIEEGLIDEFDINLFYLLLQRVCPLPGPSDRSWGRDVDVESLPSILYQIKMLRNAMAHSYVDITEKLMKDEIDNLERLFLTALSLAGNVFSCSEEGVQEAKEKISVQLASIKSVDSSTIDQLRRNAEQKLTLATEEAKLELLGLYDRFSKVLLAPWTAVESLQNINDIFTEPLLKHNKNNILFQQIEEDETFIEVPYILVSRLCDGSVPNFILLVSKSGMGKTTLAKFIIRCWVEKNHQQLKGIDDVDLVLYMDCRSSNCATFEEFLADLLPNTVHLFGSSELKVLIKSMRVLIILDNIDELRDATVSTYSEILNMNTDRLRVLATSSHNIAPSIGRPYQQKHLLLDLEGVSNRNISTCISKIYSTIFGNLPFDANELQLFCSEYKIHTNENIKSPEVLSHIFFHWIMRNKSDVIYASKTQIFYTTHDLLCLKLLEKIGANVQTKVVERKVVFDQLNKFFKKLFQKAFEMFANKECEISLTTLEDMQNECNDLDLPYTKIFKDIFCFKDVQNRFIKFTSVTFASTSMQIFYAAMYIADELISCNQDIMELLPKNIYKANDLLLFLKFIVGILAAKDILALEKHIGSIFSCIHRHCPGSSSKIWAEFAEETRCHPMVMCEVKKHLGDTWSFEDHEITATLLILLKSYPPYQLSLTTCINPNELSSLKRTLEICSQTKGLCIFLHLYYHFWVDKRNTSDDYLNILLKSDGQANVESFAGRLSAKAILKVPVSVKRLALHLRPEEITILNTSLLRLTSLVLLYLNFDINSCFPAKRVPRLKLPRTNIILYVDLWKISKELVSWSCEVLAALSPAYCQVTLRKTKFDFAAAKEWLEELRHCRVHVDSLAIGSIVSISQEEIGTLKEISSSFECLDFKWLPL